MLKKVVQFKLPENIITGSFFISRYLLAASLIALSAATAHAETVTVASPNGRNIVTLDSEKLTYAVSRDGKAVIDPSPLGLNLDIGQISAGATYTTHHTGPEDPGGGNGGGGHPDGPGGPAAGGESADADAGDGARPGGGEEGAGAGQLSRRSRTGVCDGD